MSVSGDIRILQWNCFGIRSKIPQLQFIANNADIICVQESMLFPHNNFWLRGFKVIRKDIASHNQRGICTLVRDNLIFSNIDLSICKHPSWEVQALSIFLVDESIGIVNIYRHPNQHTPYNVYSQLIRVLSNKCRKFVILGDFNAHHSWWGCSFDDSFGKILSNVIDTHRLIILNDRTSPTLFHPTARHSIIDLVISSEDLAAFCSSYVGHDTFGSDHFPIFTSIVGSFKLESRFLYKLNLSSKDLTFLHHSLYNSLVHLKNSLSNSCIPAYTALEQHIRKHLYSLFPSKSCHPKSYTTRPKPSTPPWWNDTCQEAVNDRRKSIRTFYEHPSTDSFEAYKRARLKCSKTLKKQKRLGWQKYCTLLNHKTPTSEIWSLIKSFKRRKMTQAFSTQLVDYDTQIQLVRDTIDKLCPPSCKQVVWNSLSLMEIRDEQLGNVKHELGQPFVETELRSAINSVKLNTAPGLDQIDNRAISSLPYEYLDIILTIYNNILIEGSFPDQWRQSLVVLIPKPDARSLRTFPCVKRQTPVSASSVNPATP